MQGFIPTSTEGPGMMIDPNVHKLRMEKHGHGRCISIHPTKIETVMKEKNRTLLVQVRDQNTVIAEQNARMNEQDKRMAAIEAMLKGATS